MPFFLCVVVFIAPNMATFRYCIANLKYHYGVYIVTNQYVLATINHCTGFAPEL